MTELSRRVKESPYILIGAIVVGAVIAQLVGGPIPWLIDFTQAGIFLVILSIMVSVEIKDVSREFRKVKPTAVALFINFAFVPLFTWTLGWLFLESYPDLPF